MDAAGPAAPATERADLWVIGNALIDLIVTGVAEIPPWGKEVLASGRSTEVGGQGANLARATARIGVSTVLVSVVGEDSAAADIRGVLRADGVKVNALPSLPGRTALAIAAVRSDGERAFITDLGSSAELAAQHVAEFVPEICRSRAVALVGTSNLPGLDLTEMARLLQEARGHGVLTLFDPGWGPEIVRSGSGMDEILGSVDVFLPNLDEAEALTGERDLPAILSVLSERCGGTVIVTCGEMGSAILDRGTPILVEALPVKVVNAVGAGDVFAAGVISGLLDGDDPVEAMVRGTAVVAGYISRAENRYAALAEWREHAAAVTIRAL